MSISSSPFLLALSTRLVQEMLRARYAVLDIDKNPLLHWILKRTFYKQFCAGENTAEVSKTVREFHESGSGVMLEYAKEVLERGSHQTAAQIAADISQWREGVLQTVEMVASGDMVALKWSGMGSEALRLMRDRSKPSAQMFQAMIDICDSASAKGVCLMPSAEPQNANHAVDDWNLDLARRYNVNGKILIYNTYQAYLKSTPATLAIHLHWAEREGFALGVKLVRGAYLHSEPRELIWETKEETDAAYDGIAADVLQRRYSNVLRPVLQPYNANSMPGLWAHTIFPAVGLNLATHNRDSVRKAIALRANAVNEGIRHVPMQFAQLQGMADDLNCEIISEMTQQVDRGGPMPQVLKFVTWGSMKDCLHYLLRRADENKDAMIRTIATRRVVGSEIRRRVLAAITGP